MLHRFSSRTQQTLFAAVVNELQRLGYTGSLLRENYRFPDYFANENKAVTADAVAFGQEPVDPNSACFAVILANGERGTTLVNQYRALGAPRAFEITDEAVVHWRVSLDLTEADRQATYSHETLGAAFQEHQNAWQPSSVLRARNIAPIGQYQTDFFDLGLIPALEGHLRDKLDPFLRSIIYAAKSDVGRRNIETLNEDSLFRLLFRALMGKMMHDRGLVPFASINGPSDPATFLSLVAAHYQDPTPIAADPELQQLVLERFWEGMGLEHLSIDVLAYVWENMLVSDEVRQTHGIHATPPNVARLLAQSLIDSAPLSAARIVEPCCGSGTFLIAALQRMRELLPAAMSVTDRHNYFAKTLHGFDVEVFGIEVAQSCLTLADYPNHNGWQLRTEDVFGTSVQSPHFNSSLKKARFVLCNPPFEDFSDEERHNYRVKYIQRPAELLNRVLDTMPSDAELGFILPYQAIDGRSYKPLRRRIGERFAHLDVVQLPEGVFQKAKFPAIMLVAKQPTRQIAHTTLRFSEVTNAKEFLRARRIDRTQQSTKSVREVEQSLSIPKLFPLWDFLGSRAKLDSATSDIARGVEWEGFHRERHLSVDPKPGFLPGFHLARELRCFESPRMCFLNAKDDRRRNAWDKPWHLPKVVCNAVRKKTGPWKIAACAIDLNLLCTQNFTVLWPQTPWTSRSLAAVMNGLVACSFMASHEMWKHLTKENLSQLPIPMLDDSDIATLDSLVHEYEHLARVKLDELDADDASLDSHLRELLMRIDRIVLLGYDLPARFLEKLLDLFNGYQRPASVQYDIQLLRHAPSTHLLPSIDINTIWPIVERGVREGRI